SASTGVAERSVRMRGLRANGMIMNGMSAGCEFLVSSQDMAISSTQAVRHLAELLEIDRSVRGRRQPLSLTQKQRRSVIVRALHQWALARQRGAPPGAEQRQHPRANVQ